VLPEVERLAEALGAWMGLPRVDVAVGGTRKVVDEGWLPRTRQIGITGHAVSPDLYVAVALNGNFNHTSGMLGARTVLALNARHDAPIFEASDIGVVADWREVSGALVGLLEKS
jgi:electron transfer flavoprotein alpha subunit